MPSPNPELRLSDPADTYISSADIQATVERVAAQLSNTYYDTSELRILTVLNGALPFADDLVGTIDHECVTLDTIRVKSYAGVTSNGQPKIIKPAELPMEGVPVVVVEDIVERGYTLVKLLKHLRSFKPASLEVVSLLEKPDERAIGTQIQEPLTTGIKIASKYVVGYGLDYHEQFREWRHISECEEVQAGLWVPKHFTEPKAA